MLWRRALVLDVHMKGHSLGLFTRHAGGTSHERYSKLHCASKFSWMPLAEWAAALITNNQWHLVQKNAFCHLSTQLHENAQQ